MKTPQKLILALSVLVTIGAIVTKSSVIQAQQTVTQEAPPTLQTPAPVTINPAPVHYKVIDIGVIPVAKARTPAGTLESILNDMGLNGWRVVTTSGSFVILMQ